MAMFPIFIIGLIVGWILGYILSIYKKETPSETKFRIQEAELIRYRSDKEMLNNLVDKLYKKIDTLEKELKN